MKIKSIEINAFRGIPFLKLDLQNGKGLVLQGENGTGKSSIADAIEFFFTGDITQLKGKQSVSLKKHGTNVNFTPDDLKIEMVIKQDKNTDYTIKRTLNSPVEYPESLEKYFNVADNRTFILRRSQLLKFIESSPSDRYKFIGTVLGVEKLENIELEMQRAQKYLKQKIKEKNDKIMKIKEKLSICLDSEIKKEIDLIQAINRLIESQGDYQIESVDEIEDCYEKLDSLTNQHNIKKLNALNEISSSIETVNTLNEDIMKEFHQADFLKNEILEIHGISDLPLIKILNNAKEILQGMHLEKCPLCEQTIQGEELQTRINERLETLEDLSGSKEKLKESIKSLKRLFESSYTSLKTINNNIVLFADLNNYRNHLNSEMELLQIFTDGINYQIFLKGEITNKDLNNRIQQLETILNPINDLIDDIKASLETSTKEDNIIILQILREVNENYLKLINLQKKILICQKHEQIAGKLFSTFSEVKKQKIQEIYDSIEQDIQYFYDSLHPHESHKNIKLGIDPSKRSSTNLKMEIFGRDDEDPRGLNSEGHLDSLGLCVFLALVKEFNQNFPIVVLDDVVTTVDSRHREKICKLLFEEFKDKQFIITTHDAIWFDQLRAAQRAYKLDNKFRNMNIVGWDLEGGPILKPYVPIKSRIQQKIGAGDRNCAGNEVRRYLEWLLDEICKNTNAPVPLNPDGRYDAKVLFDSARNRLIDKVKDQEFKENITESFQNLEKTMIMGNILSHNNLFAGNISINEVENFWKSVQELDGLMSCPNCGKPLKQYKELEILRCSKINCQNPLIIRFR